MDTWALARSLEQHVWVNANGDPERVEFAFMYYGRFVDMGVGEGKSLTGALSRDQRKIVKGYMKAGRDEMAYSKWDAFSTYNKTYLKERIPKKWYSPVFYAEVMKLQNILAEKYGMKAAQMIVENIEVKAHDK